MCLVPVGAPAAQPSTPIDGAPGDTDTDGDRVVRSLEGGDRSVTVTVTVSDEFGAIRTETATVPIRPTTVEEQGPGLGPALVIALAVCALAARRYR